VTIPERIAKVGRGAVRIVPFQATLDRVRPLLERVGITRVANITGLDRIGIPTVAVIRPNAKCYSVAQGKGTTLEAAKASGIMEAIENFHAEEVSLPLRLASYAEARRKHRVVDVSGLPRLAFSTFTEHTPILWAEGAVDVITGERVLVPHEVVHLDFRTPLPQGSGCFIMSSNGLASGNHALEAMVHALCEVIERDSNTLWNVAGRDVQHACRIDLATVDDATCKDLLQRFDAADVSVRAWNTTTDVGVASILCEAIDREATVDRPMLPVSGSGAHPDRNVALRRALTEAAQSRLTRISGSRDDLFHGAFDDDVALHRTAAARAEFAATAANVSFTDIPSVEHEDIEDDVTWILRALEAVGISEVLMLNLTRPDLDIPVVRVIVPHLEGMSEVTGFVPGRRARRALGA
jgi:YcaO-like protein with predicted kinase domain